MAYTRYETFGEALTDLMQKRGMTQAELARELDTYDANVQRWRQGKGISYDKVVLIAEVFGVSQKRLLKLAGYDD